MIETADNNVAANYERPIFWQKIKKLLFHAKFSHDNDIFSPFYV